PREGRVRAMRHAVEQDNLLLETSWCGWRDAAAFVDRIGADRVLFGSDAVADGHTHYLREPPNVEGRETYNGGLVSLVRALGPAAGGRVRGRTARGVSRLDNELAASGAQEARSRRAG